MKNIFKISAFSLLFFGLAFSFSAEANNLRLNCQPNDICRSISDDLPERSEVSGGVDPNKAVNLSLSVYQKDSAEPPACASGKQLFHAVRHNIDGQADVWDYYAAGTGQDLEYSFSSGPYGQRNRYSGVFYCWTKALIGTDRTQYSSNDNFVRAKKYLADPLGGLCPFVQGQSDPLCPVWQTPELNLLTRNVPTPTPTPVVTPVVTTQEKKVPLNFPNPLAAEDFNELLETIQTWLIYLALPIAVIVIVISGIMMMASRGDLGQFTKAKKMLWWAMVGLAVILIGEGFLYLIESIINLKNR